MKLQHTFVLHPRASALSLAVAVSLCAVGPTRPAPQPTIGPAAVKAAAHTNQPAVPAEDAEAAEIRRLQASGYRNDRVADPAAASQASKLIMARRERLFEKVRQATNPWPALLEIAHDPIVESLPDGTVSYLMAHADDPRSEEILLALSRKGSGREGELPTPAGIAARNLAQLHAKRQFDAAVAGSQTDPDRTMAIITFLESRPDLALPRQTRLEDALLANMLLDELEQSDDPVAVRLLLGSGHIKPAFAKKHFAEMLAYAGGLTGAQALANPALVESLGCSGDPSIIPLFEKWLRDAKDEHTKQFLELKLRQRRP